MSRLVTALILTLLVLLFATPPAKADMWPYQGVELHLIEKQIHPTCSPVQFRFAPYAEFVPLQQPGFGVPIGYADPGTCSIAIREDVPTLYDYEQECSLLAHELGHLSGLSHSTDPHNFMYPSLVAYPPCAPLGDIGLLDKSIAALRSDIASQYAAIHKRRPLCPGRPCRVIPNLRAQISQDRYDISGWQQRRRELLIQLTS
jgi:hypothetical protein